VPGADLARVRALAGRLQGRPGVSMAGPQLALRAIGSATPDDYGPVDWNASSPDRRIWHHRLIGADRAWGFASRTEVDVGIVDSDIHLEHEDWLPTPSPPHPPPPPPETLAVITAP